MNEIRDLILEFADARHTAISYSVEGMDAMAEPHKMKANLLLVEIEKRFSEGEQAKAAWGWMREKKADIDYSKTKGVFRVYIASSSFLGDFASEGTDPLAAVLAAMERSEWLRAHRAYSDGHGEARVLAEEGGRIMSNNEPAFPVKPASP
jgi:hypothetical protein